MNAVIKVRTKDFNENGELTTQIIETTVGRVLFNAKVPEAAGFINQVLTKKSLRDIIGTILKVTNVPETAVITSYSIHYTKLYDLNKVKLKYKIQISFSEFLNYKVSLQTLI